MSRKHKEGKNEEFGAKTGHQALRAAAPSLRAAARPSQIFLGTFQKAYVSNGFFKRSYAGPQLLKKTIQPAAPHLIYYFSMLW